MNFLGFDPRKHRVLRENEDFLNERGHQEIERMEKSPGYILWVVICIFIIFGRGCAMDACNRMLQQKKKDISYMLENNNPPNGSASNIIRSHHQLYTVFSTKVSALGK